MSGRRTVGDLLPLAVVLLLVLAAGYGPTTSRSSPGTLAVLIDVSASVAPAARERGLAEIERRLARLPAAARVAVFAFDAAPRLLAHGDAAAARTALETARGLPAGTGSDLARAIAEADLWVRANGGGSVLAVTDGIEPGGGGALAASRAQAAGVRVHVLPLDTVTQEVVLEALEAPASLRPGELFTVAARVRSTIEQTIDLTLEIDGVEIGRARTRLDAGTPRVLRNVIAVERSGLLVARVAGELDSDPGNNLSRRRLTVGAAPRLAVVGAPAPGGLVADHHARVPSAATLARYDGILLRLDAATLPSPEDQERLARWVETGHGLVVSCPGDPELAARLRGGPLEVRLPVRLVPPRADEDEAAVVVLLDRSGSMDRGGSGRSALALARDAVAALAALLSGRDRYGLIAFDVSAHVLRPLRPLGEPDGDPAAGGAVAARGGTDWGPALAQALDWLEADPARSKHIVLVGDGRLGEGLTGEPDRPWPAGITLSTVSVGARADQQRMERLAALRGGRHEHVRGLHDLPAALRREAARLRYPERREGPLALEPTAAFAGVLPPAALRPGGGALVVAPRADAEVALRTARGDAALSFGVAGWGRTAFLASDPREIAGGDRLLELALRRVLRADEMSGGAPVLTYDGASVTIEALAGADDAATQAVVRAPSGAVFSAATSWDGSERLRARFVPEESGEYAVELAERRARVIVSAAAERVFLGRDREWAARLAGAGGGAVLAAPGSSEGVPLPLTRARRRIELAAPLIALAAIAFFVDSARRLLLPGGRAGWRTFFQRPAGGDRKWPRMP